MDYVTQRIREYAGSVASELARLKCDQLTLEDLLPGADKGAIKALDRKVGLAHPLASALRDPIALDALESGVGAERAISFLQFVRREAALPRNWPPTRAALQAWAEKAGVEHVLLRTARHVSTWETYSPQLSVADLFDDETWHREHVLAERFGTTRKARQSAWAMLTREANELAEARDNPGPPWPLPEGRARKLGQRLKALREPLLSRWPRLDGVAGLDLHVDVDRGIARLNFAAEVREGTQEAFTPTVELDVRNPRDPSCSCGRESCFHLAAGLDRIHKSLLSRDYHSQQLLEASAESWGLVLHAMERYGAVDEAFAFAGFRVKIDIEITLEALELGDRGKKPRKTVPQAMLDSGQPLSAQERRVLELLAAQRRFHAPHGGLDGEALWAMRGHPSVYLRGGEGGDVRRDHPVKVTGHRGVLTFDDAPGKTTMRWKLGDRILDGLPKYPRVGCFDGDSVIPVELPGELLLARLSEDAARFEDACERFGRSFPPESHRALSESLGGLKRVETELPASLRGEELPASGAVSVRALFTPGPQLDLSFHVTPLEKGAALVPGEGAAEVSEWRGRGRVFCRRDLSAELEQARVLSTRLALPPHDEEPFSWRLTEVEQVLETAARMTQLATEGVKVELPAGSLSVSRPAQTQDLKLRLAAKGAWFKLDGKAAFDGVELPLDKVLEAIRGGRRWVELSANKLMRLSEQLAQALGPVALSSSDEGEVELTLPQVAALSAQEAAFGELESATTVKKLLEKMQSSSSERVTLPRGFKAKLRDYQREGYEWLCRLSTWAPGAVLADDMGLGKTVQALALLSARAGAGPQLVVAPTSVTANWLLEAARFAPGLTLLPLREGERTQAISSAKAGEVLVASWTLMAKEIDALEKRDFVTVVLDESQAIKNAGTQRAQAARRLKAGFMLALTGTPLENHLGELWSLFRVVSPGLFGSEQMFRARYAAPISGGDEREKTLAWASLRALVKPFLLRRRKDQVATELPKKTEVTRLIALEAKEAGVYEAARREAMEALEHAVEERGEQARFHVLAAITRLRQLACHVGLVDASWTLGSSKLTALVELLTELKDEGHKVLVFSQFTSLLAKAEEAVKAAGLSWLLLQGDTPAADRQQRIDAFQRGEADVFLLSLKAGGTGLNLTAADYVVHLDPWWNPAVEDQASDRAHRIGQTRPVTVYRLVAEGTIEEKILSLHGKKRELVESVLEGTQAASKLSSKELVELLSQG